MRNFCKNLNLKISNSKSALHNTTHNHDIVDTRKQQMQELRQTRGSQDATDRLRGGA